MQPFKKVVIIGPESTGKSTLCKELAPHYNSLSVPEHAREYLEKNGTNYTFEDLLTIAKGQIESEDELSSVVPVYQHSSVDELPNHPLLFIDTDMYVMKVWCEFVFNKCHNWILNQIANRHYDLYLLCNIDLPWVKDNLREYPDLKSRARLYHHYMDVMINQSTPWVTITGNYAERLDKAIQAIDLLIL